MQLQQQVRREITLENLVKQGAKRNGLNDEANTHYPLTSVVEPLVEFSAPINFFRLMKSVAGDREGLQESGGETGRE